jgi:hypothetical protein
MKKATQISLNTTELKDFLSHIINNNRYLQTSGKNPVAVNIEGEAGINSK